MKPEPFAVRQATIADAATIAEFDYQMAFETEGKRLDRIVLQAGVGKGLARPELCRYFVAELDKQIVGQAMTTYEWSDWRAGSFWWIQSVYVLPEFRGRGVFRALYRHIEALARRTPEVCGLRLYVHEGNRQATATYRRLGMCPSGHLVYEADWSTLARPQAQPQPL